MSQEALKYLLTGMGWLCEAAGLLWIVAEASRARSREFGEHGPFRRVYRWFAYWLGPPPKPQSSHVGGIVRAKAGVTASLSRSNETDVERLERLIGQLDKRLTGHQTYTTTRFEAVENRLRDTSTELSQRLAEATQRVTEQRRSALRGEVRGAYLFIVGATFSAVANLL